ncbi:MAG: sensor histidine kinase [Flavobacteriaceae bacterium]
MQLFLKIVLISGLPNKLKSRSVSKMKILKYFYIPLLLMVGNLAAQDIYSLDSLKEVFETTKDTLNKIDAGRRLWYTNLRFYNFCLYNNDDYKQQAEYYRNKVNLLELSYKNTPVRFNREIDQIIYKMEDYQYNLKYDSLLWVGRQAINKINQLKTKTNGNTQIELLIGLMAYQAEVVSFNNDINAAVIFLIEALKIAEEENLETSEIRVKYNISKLLLYNFYNNPYAYDKAFDILKNIKEDIKTVKSTEVFSKADYEDKINYYFTHYSPGESKGLYIDLDAYFVYLLGKELYNAVNEKIEHYNALGHAPIEEKIANLKEITTLLEAHNFKNTYLYAQLQNRIGDHYFQASNYKAAYYPLNWVFELLESKQYINTHLFDYEKLYTSLEQISKETGHYEKAYLFSQKANDFKLKKSANSFVSVISLLKAYESSQIHKLQQDISKQRFKKLVAYSVLIVIAIVVTFFMFSYRANVLSHREISQKNTELEKTMHEKLELEKKIENIQTAIAKDLHDNFGNRISNIVTTHSILKDINNSEKGLDHNNFTHFSNCLEESLYRLTQDIKDLIWINNKDNNSLQKVIERIRLYVSEESHSQTTNVALSVKLSQPDYSLPKFWNRQLLLITKEAINNAIKHAKATEINVAVTVNSNNFLTIACTDNGIGFNIEELNRISGLDNMRVRATSIDCQIKLESEQNKGTTIVLFGYM